MVDIPIEVGGIEQSKILEQGLQTAIGVMVESDTPLGYHFSHLRYRTELGARVDFDLDRTTGLFGDPIGEVLGLQSIRTVGDVHMRITHHQRFFGGGTRFCLASGE